MGWPRLTFPQGRGGKADPMRIFSAEGRFALMLSPPIFFKGFSMDISLPDAESTVEFGRQLGRALNEQYAEGGESRPTPVWHGICASILARTQWGVEDEAILSAIACHTAGKPGMSKLDKIVYLADMTSAERDWPGVNKLRKLELKDLDAAMLAALKQTNDFVFSQGKPLDPVSKAAYDDIKARVNARG